jgi:poly(3-hydroxyalkanoate) depolymerase
MSSISRVLGHAHSVGSADPAAVNGREGQDGIDVRTIAVGHQPLCVATTRGPKGRPPRLLFNGIGANWQVAKPFLHALTKTAAIIFDVPGIGGSPIPSLPYRPSTLARLAAGVVAQLGHWHVDVAGVSWGGRVAQQFAHQHGDTCRKLVLAATLPGAIMLPGKLSVAWKLATPRRYVDRNYMRSIAAEVYGGAFRSDAELIATHAEAMVGVTSLGYLFQLLAMTGWTS